MTWHVTRIRRDALSGSLNALLAFAAVGQRVHLTFYGVESDAVITELTPEWVEFRPPPAT